MRQLTYLWTSYRTRYLTWSQAVLTTNTKYSIVDQLATLEGEHLNTCATITISSKVKENTKCLVRILKVQWTIQLKGNGITVPAIWVESGTNLYITVRTLWPNKTTVGLPVTKPSSHNTLYLWHHMSIYYKYKVITLWILTLSNHLVHSLLEKTNVKLVKYKLSGKTLCLWYEALSSNQLTTNLVMKGWLALSIYTTLSKQKSVVTSEHVIVKTKLLSTCHLIYKITLLIITNLNELILHSSILSWHVDIISVCTYIIFINN